MANHYRGEVDISIDGKTYTLCLTLGVLAELEATFQKTNLVDLAERFSQGRLSACDILNILSLGLKGGGYTITKDELSEMHIDGGVVGAVRAVSDLLAVTFGATEENV